MEVIMSDANQNAVAIQSGDTIKFQIVGEYAEEAHHFLPELRDRAYWGIVITELNEKNWVTQSPLRLGFMSMKYQKMWASLGEIQTRP